MMEFKLVHGGIMCMIVHCYDPMDRWKTLCGIEFYPVGPYTTMSVADPTKRVEALPPIRYHSHAAIGTRRFRCQACLAIYNNRFQVSQDSTCIRVMDKETNEFL